MNTTLVHVFNPFGSVRGRGHQAARTLFVKELRDGRDFDMKYLDSQLPCTRRSIRRWLDDAMSHGLVEIAVEDTRDSIRDELNHVYAVTDEGHSALDDAVYTLWYYTKEWLLSGTDAKTRVERHFDDVPGSGNLMEGSARMARIVMESLRDSGGST